MTSHHPVVNFDHMTEEFVDARHSVLATLRNSTPIAWSENLGGFWVVTSHELVTKILRDSAHFSAERYGDGTGGILVPENPDQAPLFPGETEGERHDRYRRALNPFFSKKVVETFREQVGELINELLVQVGDGEFDVVNDFARILPQRVVFSYAGIDVDDPWNLYAGIRDMRDANKTELGETTRARLLGMLEEKRNNPTDDLLGALVRFDDPPFSDADLVALLVGLVLGGVATTTDLIAQVFWQLDVDRELRGRLDADRSLIPGAVEEMLRTFTPSFGLARTALADVEIGGVTIAKGERVLNVFLSANHDEKRFANPYAIDLDRGSSQHVSFGLGTHFCLGAWLARMEARMVVEAILDKIPSYRIDHYRAKPGDIIGIHHHWLTMPATICEPVER